MIRILNNILLKKTKPMLQAFFPYIIKKKIVFLGTQYEKNNALQYFAKKHSHYYANKQWLEGFLTNRKTLIRIHKQSKELHRKYFFNVRLKAFLRALHTLPNLPNLAFITNTSEQAHILHEMELLDIPVFLTMDLFRHTSHKIDIRRSPYPMLGSERNIGSALFFMFFIYKIHRRKCILYKQTNKKNKHI